MIDIGNWLSNLISFSSGKAYKVKTNEMKIETLVKIARQIEKELGTTAFGIVSEVTARLREVAGDCETKRDATERIARQIYDLNSSDTPNLHIKATTFNI